MMDLDAELLRLSKMRGGERAPYTVAEVLELMLLTRDFGQALVLAELKRASKDVTLAAHWSESHTVLP